MDPTRTTMASDRNRRHDRPRRAPMKAGVEEFPLRVIPDWDVQKKCADTLCRLIDRHLDYEAGARSLRDREQFAPGDLCPEQRIQVRVIDACSVKPIDEGTLHRAAADIGGRMVVVEDHCFEGGLGEAVLDAFVGREAKAPTLIKLAVREMPGSGTPAELLHAAGIDADPIVTAVKSLL
jgi:hypothetical protein